MPKSSSDTRTPRPRSSCRLTTDWPGSSAIVSVISRTTRSAGMPCSSSSAVTPPAKPGSRRSRAETLMLSTPGARSPCSAIQPASSAERGPQHPVAQRHDQAGALGQRDERVRGQRAARRVGPADQRLGADHAAVVQRDDRLVEQEELAGGDAVAQLRAQVGVIGAGRGHVRVVVQVGGAGRGSWPRTWRCPRAAAARWPRHRYARRRCRCWPGSAARGRRPAPAAGAPRSSARRPGRRRPGRRRPGPPRTRRRPAGRPCPRPARRRSGAGRPRSAAGRRPRARGCR